MIGLTWLILFNPIHRHMRIHESRPKLQMQLKRLRYYWLSMTGDCVEFVRRCQEPSEPLHATTHCRPFVVWIIDMVGPFEKATGREYKHILAAMNYYSKWAKSIVFRDFTTIMVAKFNQIYLYTDSASVKLLRSIITTDNGQPFKSVTL